MASASLLSIAALFAARAMSGHGDVLTDRSLYNKHSALSWALAALAIPDAIATCHEPSGPRDRTLGDLSYSLYLVHWPMVMMMRASESVTVLDACLWVLASGLVAFAALELIDKPIQKWRARWVSGQAAAGKPEPAF